MNDVRILALIDDLLALPGECPWVEFKENNFNPEVIGVRISALSNAARLADEHCGYIVWGVRDADHHVVGTNIDPSDVRVKNEPIEFWLNKRLQPNIPFIFRTVNHPKGRLLLLEIPAAATAPIEFDRTAYIRIGSATPRLSDNPTYQQMLWAKLQSYVWESGLAKQFLTGDEVLSHLDYASYFSLARQPLPDNRQGIFERLSLERLISSDVGGHWNITNLGAILFARDLTGFDTSLARKGVRFVAYDGNSRANNVTHRRDSTDGYANGFKSLVDYINGVLPQNEQIGAAFRTQVAVFPPLAIRELLANALIHQNMTITGTGPLIELFKDRMEITNPGSPLIRPERFIDSPPRSRNEALAALMRRLAICEEQGTGIDKVITQVEFYQLPPPEFRAEEDAMRVVLYAPRNFAAMTDEERIRACYQHAVLKYVSGERMRNQTLRERLGIPSVRLRRRPCDAVRQAIAVNLVHAGRPHSAGPVFNGHERSIPVSHGPASVRH